MFSKKYKLSESLNDFNNRELGLELDVLVKKDATSQGFIEGGKYDPWDISIQTDTDTIYYDIKLCCNSKTVTISANEFTFASKQIEDGNRYKLLEYRLRGEVDTAVFNREVDFEDLLIFDLIKKSKFNGSYYYFIREKL